MSFTPNEEQIKSLENIIDNIIIENNYEYNGKKIINIKAKYDRASLISIIVSGFNECIKYTGFTPINSVILEWARYIYLLNYLKDINAASLLLGILKAPISWTIPSNTIYPYSYYPFTITTNTSSNFILNQSYTITGSSTNIIYYTVI